MKPIELLCLVSGFFSGFGLATIIWAALHSKHIRHSNEELKATRSELNKLHAEALKRGL